MTTIKRKGTFKPKLNGDELTIEFKTHVDEVSSDLFLLMDGEVSMEITDNQTTIGEFQK